MSRLRELVEAAVLLAERRKKRKKKRAGQKSGTCKLVFDIVGEPTTVCPVKEGRRKLIKRTLQDVEPTDLESGLGGKKPTPAEIAQAIAEIVTEMGGDARGINGGNCDIFAEELVDKLGYGFAMEVLAEDEDEGYDDDFPSHAFVQIDDKYYDAETPAGISDWRKLPTFTRWKSRK